MYWNITDRERFLMSFEITKYDKLRREFIETLFTEKEIEQYALRLKVMCMLHDLATYEQISKATGYSPNTIARLSKIMNDRENPIKKVLAKFKKEGGGKAYFD